MHHARGTRRAIAAAVALCAFGWTGVADAQDEARGVDPHQGESLVEVTLPSRGAAMRLQLEAETYGVEFNEHYLRRNGDGTVTATVFGDGDELKALEDAGFELGATIEGPRPGVNGQPTAKPTCAPRSAPRPPPRATRSASSPTRTRS
jgi:hypothetical protein